ncbi:MAG: VWA domain-containing protein [Pyrinomonadaceae bacterium]
MTIIFILSSALCIFAQSGRKKKVEEKKPEAPTQKGEYILTESPNATPTPTKISTVNPPPPLESDDVIKINSSLVPIPVSVTDNKTGAAVSNLLISDFQLLVNGEPEEIGELFRSDAPVRLALLFDNSSSVTLAREFEQKAAIKFLNKVLRPKLDRAALYSISSSPLLEQAMTKDVKTLVRAIAGFSKPEGATALLDGIYEASNYLQDFVGRRVIVIVSDGQDTLSDHGFEKVVRTVQENNCQIFIVQTNEFENFKRTGTRSGSANLRALVAETRMKTLANETGGAVYSPVTEEELDRAFSEISAELSEQYVLGYYPETEVRDGQFRKLEVRVSSAKPVTVRARTGYYVSTLK